MRKSFLEIGFILSLIFGAVYSFADSTTSRLGLVLPSLGSTGWATKTNNNWTIVASSVAALGLQNTFTSTNTFNGPFILGDPLGVEYGGLGLNIGTVGPGSILYFSDEGVLSPLSAGTSGHLLSSENVDGVAWIDPASLEVATATYSSTAGTAASATHSTTSDSATTASSATYSTTAGSALTASTATYAVSAATATWVINGIEGGNANNLNGGGVGQIPYQSATDTTVFLSTGAEGNVLTSHGAAAPTWETASSGGGDSIYPATSTAQLDKGFTASTGTITTLTNFSGRFSSTGELANVVPWTSQTAGAGTANFGPTGSHTSVEWIGVGHLYRIRQNGTVRQSKIYVASTSDITEFYLKIWRYNGSTYDLVGQSENLSAQLSVGVSTLTLATGIIAQEGDYVGARVIYDGAISAANFFSANATSASSGWESYPTQYDEDIVNTFSVVDAAPGATAYNWASQTALADKIVIQECAMDAPVFVSLGDSITSGSGGSSAFTTSNSSFIDILMPTTHIEYSYPYHLGTALRYSHQNMGIGGDSVSNMAARFATDVAALHPQFIVIMGGVNDINGGASAESVAANFTTILDAADAAGIIPVVIGTLPEAPHANITAWRKIDTLNGLLEPLVESYGGVFVPPGTMGQFYSGGDANNLWQLKPAYKCAADNVHLSTTGYAALASLVSATLDNTETLFTVANAESAGFSIDKNGNITKINGVAISFPSTQGAANTYPKNDGAGRISWVTVEASTATSSWTTSGDNIYNNNSGSVGIGSSSPGATLDVVGTLRVTGTSSELDATGGSTTTADGYKIHTFTTNGTFTLTGSGTIEYLIAGGGGSGAAYWGGGGSGARVSTGTVTLSAGTYSVVVGTGSVGGDPDVEPYWGKNGTPSSFNSIVADGGSYGAYNAPGGNGFNGGGGGTSGLTGYAGGTGTSGYNGGSAGTTGQGYPTGGGASQIGNGGNASTGQSGNGADGITSSITGTAHTYGSAGGGGIRTGTAGLGGGEDGGDGNNNGDGEAGMDGRGAGGGGGGGAAGTGHGGKGGDGVVILRYIPGTNASSFTVAGSTSTVNVSVNSKTSTGSETGTLTNAPSSGNPVGYLSVNINGVERKIPYW